MNDAEPKKPPPLPTKPFLSVLVPARASATTLPDALRRLLEQDYTGRYEVLVACPPDDNATREVLAPYGDDPRVRVVDNPAGTTPAALNAAIDAAEGQVLVRVDAHAVPPRTHLRRCVETLKASDAGNVGGPQVAVGEQGFARAVADAMRSPLGSGGAIYRTGTEPGPADTVYLGAFRREALDDVGGFDETLERNQDYELNWRLRRAGWLVYFDADLAVGYRPRSSLAGLARQYLDYGRWKRHMLRRNPQSIKARQVAAPLVVLALAACFVTAAALPAAWPLTGPGAYALALLIAGVSASHQVSRAPATAAALAVIHLAWGLGFLVVPLPTTGGPRGASSRV